MFSPGPCSLDYAAFVAWFERAIVPHVTLILICNSNPPGSATKSADSNPKFTVYLIETHYVEIVLLRVIVLTSRILQMCL